MKSKTILASLAVCAACMCHAENDIVMECEQFADKGGWTIDLQFIDAMGFGYLLAHGVGKPVADAKTRVAAEFKGRKKEAAPDPESAPEATTIS